MGQFMTRNKSIGPLENNSGKTEFTSFEAADLDVKFLQALIKQNHEISSYICRTSYFLCASTGAKITFTNSRCKKHKKFKMFKGVLVLNVLETQPSFFFPPDFKNKIVSCKQRFFVVGFGLYPGSDLEVGHSNALIFDTFLRTVERYEPSGRANKKLDHDIAKYMKSLLGASWKYVDVVGTQEQADNFNGMCITFSLLYILLRLLNPDVKSVRLRKYLQQKTEHGKLGDDILRLNRFVAETLRIYRRGDLIRLGSKSETLSSRVKRDRLRSDAMVRRSVLQPLHEWLSTGRESTASLLK